MIRVIWNGETFAPANARSHSEANEEYGLGEVLTIDPERQRSIATHNHEFAQLADMWQTLPERLAGMPYAKSPETLRKHALIETGYCDVQTVSCGSKAVAERVAAAMAELGRRQGGYAIARVEGSTAMVFTPQSQSKRAMGAKRFQASKTAILEWVQRCWKGCTHDVPEAAQARAGHSRRQDAHGSRRAASVHVLRSEPRSAPPRHHGPVFTEPGERLRHDPAVPPPPRHAAQPARGMASRLWRRRGHATDRRPPHRNPEIEDRVMTETPDAAVPASGQPRRATPSLAPAGAPLPRESGRLPDQPARSAACGARA